MKTREDRTVEDLHESERQYQNTLEALEDPLHVVDSDMRIILANAAFEEWLNVLGFNNDILSKKLQDVFPFLPKNVFEEYSEVFEKGVTVRTKEKTEINGAIIDTETSKIPVFKEGKTIQVITVIRNTTERENLLSSLRESEERYRALFENTKDAIFLIGLDGKYIDFNKKAEELLGYSREELLKLSFREVIDPSEISSANSMFDRLLSGESMPLYERTFVKKDRSKVIVELNIALGYDSDGNPKYIQNIARDITSRREVELQVSKLSRAIEQSPASVVITDADGSIEYVNPKFTILTGYSLEEAIGKNPRILKTELTPPETYTILWETITNGKEWHGEFANRKKNGEIYWEEAWISPIHDTTGEITNFVAVKLDITKTREEQKALRESEERLELALHGGNLGVWDWNAKDDVLLFDERYANILGYTMDELKPRMKTWEHLLHPDDSAQAKRIWDDHTNGKSELYSSEHRLLTKNGDYKWVLEQGRTTERDSNGHTIRAIGTMLDITETRQGAEALKKSEERFRKFFENEPNYCYMVSPEGKILDANKTALERMGYSKTEMIGKPLSILYPEESQGLMRELLDKWRDTGQLKDEEIVIQTKSGERRIVLLSSSALRDKRGKVLHSLSIQRDITEIRTAQNELERSYRDLELYASLLQHDLRSDLQIVLGHAEAAKMVSEPGSLTETCSTVVEASSTRMVRLLDAFKRPTREEERDIVQLLEKLAEIAEIAQEGLKIEIKVENRPRGKTVNAGRLLPMVFDNLFRNAYIYGGRNVNIIITIKFTKTNVIIDVADNGPGVDETVMPRIFEKGASTSGGGYGLHLSQKVIEGYGGTMNLLTSSSKGATFRIVLPVS